MIALTRIRRWLARRRQDLAVVATVTVVIAVILVLTHGWWDEIIDALERTNPVLCVALACVLPLVGCSITLIYVVVGARFGGFLGIGLMAFATAVHLTGTHLIANSVLRGPFERLMRRRHYRLPESAHEKPAAFSLFAALVPGPPYFARNYLLALSGVPLRIYFAVCWPTYVLRSCVDIMFGEWGKDLTPTRVAILVASFALKVGVCALLLRGLYRRRRRQAKVATLPAHGRTRAV